MEVFSQRREVAIEKGLNRRVELELCASYAAWTEDDKLSANRKHHPDCADQPLTPLRFGRL